MKRLNNLFEQTLDITKIKEIICLAAVGKSSRKEVREVLLNEDYYAEQILKMLQSGKYDLKPTRKKTIIEKGKQRELTISPFFPNRILDYIMVETVKPYIRKSMYEYCIGNVDRRGMMYGKKVIAKKYHSYKYYLKLDIKKFYPSVSSKNLMSYIKRKIKDKRFLKLCEAIIMSQECLPIGSYYSQWFSNWYLQDIDHFIKEELKIPFYIRYVDDMVLFGNNKRMLRNAMFCVQRKLNEKGLCLKKYEQVNTFDKPLDFLGFRFCRAKILLRTKVFKRINRRLKKIRKNKHISVRQARSVMSYNGWLKQLKQGYLYYKNHIKPTIRYGKLRRIISDFDRCRI